MFAENAAYNQDVSVYNNVDLSGWVRVINSIMYNDTDPGIKRQMHNNYYRLATVACSDIQGSGGSGNWNSGFGFDAGGNLDCDPGFLDYLDVYGDDGELGTGDDGLIPREGVNMIDAADGISALFYDITGRERFDDEKWVRAFIDVIELLEN